MANRMQTRLPRPSPERLALRPAALAVAAACALSACGMFRGGGTPDNEPTLKTLANRKVTVDKEDVVAVNEAKAIEAYRKFLDIAPAAPQRSEAMRRIGDLEMDSADTQSLNRTEGFAHGGTPVGGAAPDYKAAVARYQEYLKTYPADPNNDRVLYQMARAYEQTGDLETAQKTLDRMVKDYPATPLRQRSAFPARRAAVHDQGLRRRREGVRDRARVGRRQPVPGPLALHARLVAVQAGPPRGRAQVVPRACSTSRSPARKARPASTRSPA